MDRPTDSADLQSAWRALVNESRADGWRVIQLGSGTSSPVLAGRRFPGSKEALLAGFALTRPLTSDSLPQAQGFSVAVAELGQSSADLTWIALCRESSGSLDLFTLMAADVRSVLGKSIGQGDEALALFLSRIRAWQDFMRRGGDRPLSPEAECGLYGELEVLCALMKAGVSARAAMDSWQGPLGGLHDFAFPRGAIEVKASVSSAGFVARIGSLDQLGDLVAGPLFLIGAQLTLNPDGETLCEKVARIRDVLGVDHACVAVFETRLIQAGFLQAHSSSYSRRFFLGRLRIYPVQEEFPRMTRASVSNGVVDASYEINLDSIPMNALTIIDVLESIGVPY